MVPFQRKSAVISALILQAEYAYHRAHGGVHAVPAISDRVTLMQEERYRKVSERGDAEAEKVLGELKKRWITFGNLRSSDSERTASDSAIPETPWVLHTAIMCMRCKSCLQSGI